MRLFFDKIKFNKFNKLVVVIGNVIAQQSLFLFHSLTHALVFSQGYFRHLISHAASAMQILSQWNQQI